MISTNAIKNTILAANAALAAIPPNPNMAAINATIISVIDNLNIIFNFKVMIA